MDDLSSLHDILVRSFNVEELRVLCLKLNIDYENLGGETKSGKALELVNYCQRHGRLYDLEAACHNLRPEQFQNHSTAREELHWRVLVGIAVIVGILAVFIWMIVHPLIRSCDEAAVDYDFETGSNDGWNVRYEGDQPLGLDARPDTVQHCGSGQYSLAFSLAQSTEKSTAQIALQTRNLRLNDKLSAWIFAPLEMPADVQASCFILEDNTNHRWPRKPDWPWYQTGNKLLKLGEWTLVECLAKDFVAKYSATGHWDEPQLIGIEFTRASGKPFAGTLYLDKIIVR